MTGPRRRWAPSILKVLFAGLLLVVLAQALDLRAAASVLTMVTPLDVFIVLALFGAGVLLSCVRWSLALSQLLDKRPGLLMLFRLYLIGSFVNLGLPMMAGGDVVRAELVRERVGSRSVAYASILTDRLIGLFAVALLAGIALLVAGPLINRPTRVVVEAMVLVVATTLSLLVLALRSSLGFRRTPMRVASLLEPMRLLARRPGILGASLTMAVVVQAVGVILPTAILAEAMGIEVAFSVHFALVPIIIIASLIPLAPNGLGVREAAFVLLYAQLGVPAEQAFALGLAWSLVLFTFGVAGGVVMAGVVRPVGAGVP